jgi:hypothetical protein
MISEKRMIYDYEETDGRDAPHTTLAMTASMRCCAAKSVNPPETEAREKKYGTRNVETYSLSLYAERLRLARPVA